ncbi:hypothetical protein QA612_16540 [Evansella sp. AB-P1]|uniref:hypothetical protein n=1 Tax=Evansella sp. AB-P1 TaxID=3037653 RepID=UPI00241E7561|nr:hypothetical protein [Evansella sp. AB-P1]MDG5789067.1 hypothetical protein [Evansella sp. AB-P1]
MKGFYRLVNIESIKMLKVVLLLCIASMATQLLLLNRELNNFTSHSMIERFENTYVASGAIVIFLLSILLFCVYFLLTIYSHYWGSKSIYTYLTLPIKREAVYFSKLTAFLLCIMPLFATQLMTIFIGYELVVWKIANVTEGPWMNNGLFLSFIRSESLQILFPLTLNGIVSTWSIIIALATGLYYGILCERSRQYWGFLLIITAIVIILYVISDRMGSPLYGYSNWYITSVSLFILSSFFIWHGMKIVKRGAIA